MQFPNIWGKDVILAFSGLEGKTDWRHPFIGALLPDRIGMRFWTINDNGQFEDDVLFSLRVAGITIRDYDRGASIIAGDLIELRNEEVFVGMRAAEHGIVAVSICSDYPCEIELRLGRWSQSIVALASDNDRGLFDLKEGKNLCSAGRTRFVIGLAEPAGGPCNPERWLNKSWQDISEGARSFLTDLPVPVNLSETEQRLFVKAASLLRLYTESPQGEIRYRHLISDRYPHRFLWLWDSAFNSLGANVFNRELAIDTLRAILSGQFENGHIPIVALPDGNNNASWTQPPILAWALDKILDISKDEDVQLWREFYGPLSRHLEWFMENRRLTETGLLAFKRNTNHATSRGGESGWDNSPRFDADDDEDNVDLSAYIANKAQILAKVASSLDMSQDSRKWADLSAELVSLIDSKMWCEEDGLYYDLNSDGQFIRMKTPACFMPMLAQCGNPGRWRRLSEHLNDPSTFMTVMPVPTLAKDDDRRTLDMWRGPTWMLTSFLVCHSFLAVGLEADARKIAERCLQQLNYWYERSGTLFEFYDSEGRRDPDGLARKGFPPALYPVVPETGWTAAIALSWLNDKSTWEHNKERE